MGLTYGKSTTVSYEALSSQTLKGIGGDLPNQTITLLRDNNAGAAPTNAGIEAGGGLYKLTLTDDEMCAAFIRVKVESSTPYVAILPLTLEIESPGVAGSGGPGYGGFSVSSYFDVLADADNLANLMLHIPAYKAGSTDDRTAALAQASDEIDRGNRWQGRKYDPTQPHEFPRVPYPQFAVDNYWCYPGQVDLVGEYGIEIWDWDSTNNVAVVPQFVLKATIIQADSILLGARQDRLDAQFDGVKDQMTGPLRETYGGIGHGDQPLCRQAYQLMQRYLLQTGRLL